LNTLSLPAAATGEGILSVNAQPWGAVSVDGQNVGHTPCDVRVRAGKHRLRVEHPRRRPWKGTVLVKPGSRSTRHVDFRLGEQ